MISEDYEEEMMKMSEGKERYLNLTFEETGSTVTTNAQIVSDRQLVRNEYWYRVYCCMTLRQTRGSLSFSLPQPHTIKILYIIHLWGEVCVLFLYM